MIHSPAFFTTKVVTLLKQKNDQSITSSNELISHA